ncbi:hypothetical protein VNO78_16393 [Psophocarpus tetragonolobus]|uniref:Uncharacterized protein n=1 Tax=Psophocarpus tetragonolobus TaxID=3891 RepID=A0AAN9SM85_PSOTE
MKKCVDRRREWETASPNADGREGIGKTSSAYYLNPRYHYDKNFNPNSEVLIGLYDTFQRMVLDTRTRIRLDQQLEKFKGAKGLFGMNMAIDTRDKKQPNDEWITKKEDSCLTIDSSWMNVHKCFGVDEGAPSKKRKRGPRNLNAKIDKQGKFIVENDDEFEDIGSREEELVILKDEDDLSDIDLGDDE